MAYIKGGSVVDGNLYIEGGLVVRNISTSTGGQLPTLDDGDAKSDYLVKFINDNGALQYSSLIETKTQKNDKTKTQLFVDNPILGVFLENTEAFEITESNDKKYCSITFKASPKNIEVTEADVYGVGISNKIEANFADSIKPGDLNESGGEITIPSSFSY